MVAISLYRGNLHQVSGAERRWMMPRRTISLNHFEFLRSKRYEAHLSLLPPQQHSSPLTTPTSTTATKTPVEANPPDPEPEKMVVGEDGDDDGACDGRDDVTTIQESISDKLEMKKESETKLHGLNQRKHILVQMLKQILNAEEEMKMRSSIQQHSSSVLPRTSLPQPEVSPDNTGFNPMLPPPKLNVDVNFASDDSGYPSSHSEHTHTQTRNQPWTYSSTISPHATPPLQVTSRLH